MKLHKLFFTILILFSAFQMGFSQENQKIKLIDDFGPTNCEMLSQEIDSLKAEFLNNLNSKVYIVIYGDKTNPLLKYDQESTIKAMMLFRRFDKNHMEFLHADDEQSLRTQLWISADSVSKPDVKEIRWDYSLPPDMKSLQVYIDSQINMGEVLCHTGYNIEFYSKLLLANPNLRGNLVILEKTVDNFYKTENKLSKTLTRSYKVPGNRLKFFYVKSHSPDVEYWLVPRKKI